MALTSWPSSPPDWLLVWAIWRFRGKPPPRPSGVPKEIWPIGWEFLRWAEWRRNGGIPSERPDVCPKIPKWGWELLKQLNIAVPIEPPAPPPPPPPPPENSWGLPSPFVFTAWGWRTDSDFRDTDTALQRMADSGVKTVGVQGVEFEAVRNVPARLRAYGFKVALWGRADSRDAQWLSDGGFDAYCPQIEGLYEYEDAVNNLEAGVGAGLSVSTVTTLAGLETYTTRPDGSGGTQSTTIEVERLIDAGCSHAWVECYTGDMQARDIGNLVGYSAAHRGIYHANPVVGLARAGVTMDSYRPDIDPYGRRIGVYLAEGMIVPRDWDALRALGT